MSKEKFKELMSDERSGGEVTPPGLSLSKIVSDIGKELKHQVEAGSHELASALFRGDAFVMYGKEGEAPDHGLSQDATKQPDQQQEQERGGMEM